MRGLRLKPGFALWLKSEWPRKNNLVASDQLTTVNINMAEGGDLERDILELSSCSLLLMRTELFLPVHRRDRIKIFFTTYGIDRIAVVLSTHYLHTSCSSKMDPQLLIACVYTIINNLKSSNHRII